MIKKSVTLMGVKLSMKTTKGSMGFGYEVEVIGAGFNIRRIMSPTLPTEASAVRGVITELTGLEPLAKREGAQAIRLFTGELRRSLPHAA